MSVFRLFLFLFITFWFVFPSTCLVAVSDLLLTFYLGTYFTVYVHQRGESPLARSRRIRDVVLVVYFDFNLWDLMYLGPKIHESFPSPGLYPQRVQGFFTLFFGFLIPKCSFNLFLIIAFLYESYLWIFSRGVRHCLGLRCGYFMQSCNLLCFFQR